MRKNASSLMDIAYKKCEYLVEGLKNNIQVAQMKEKVEATQALDSAKDELKVTFGIFRKNCRVIDLKFKNRLLKDWIKYRSKDKLVNKVCFKLFMIILIMQREI